MIPISLAEQEHCQVALLGAFPGTNDLVIRSPLFVDRPDVEGLVVQGPEKTLNALFPHLRAMRNCGDEGYVWERITRLDALHIYCSIETIGFQVYPRVTLIETMFRTDAIRHADVCFLRESLLRVTRPTAEVLEVKVGIPIQQNGSVLLGI